MNWTELGNETLTFVFHFHALRYSPLVSVLLFFYLLAFKVFLLISSVGFLVSLFHNCTAHAWVRKLVGVLFAFLIPVSFLPPPKLNLAKHSIPCVFGLVFGMGHGIMFSSFPSFSITDYSISR